jgi:hypothetical protein
MTRHAARDAPAHRRQVYAVCAMKKMRALAMLKKQVRRDAGQEARQFAGVNS